MYLTSFIHREELFRITERWLHNRPDPEDGLRLTRLLICDGFVIHETLHWLMTMLLGTIYAEPATRVPISVKGELRTALCNSRWPSSTRLQELIGHYRESPELYYREAPINGMMFLDAEQSLLGVYRVKRPRRIAEKANRRIADWIFRTVQDQARQRALERASHLGIGIESLMTPVEQMAREFIEAEREIAESFKEGRLTLDRRALSIHDVGGMKIVGETERLARLMQVLEGDPQIRVVRKSNHRGLYRADHFILEVPWDRDALHLKFRTADHWKNYLNRGIPGRTLREGIAPFLEGARPTLCLELILCTFSDMVESELGDSIHEERIIGQRNNRLYQGYLATNVEYLVECLFAVGFSPHTMLPDLPVKLWGRYLPDTIASYIRRLYGLPEQDLF